jgi:hypothetical protein
MELLVSRYEQSINGRATIGRLYIENTVECYCLEDTVREVQGIPVEQWKIPGQTAIPSGRYRVTLVWSPKHECMVPLVNDVPGFSAIEIHWGNTDRDTAGCLLLGSSHIPGQDMVSGSNAAWDEFMPKLELAFGVKRVSVDDRGKPTKYSQLIPSEEVWITYQNNFMVVTDPEIAT